MIVFTLCRLFSVPVRIFSTRKSSHQFPLGKCSTPDDMPHGYRISSWALQVCFTGTDDRPRGYCRYASRVNPKLLFEQCSYCDVFVMFIFYHLYFLRAASLISVWFSLVTFRSRSRPPSFPRSVASEGSGRVFDDDRFYDIAPATTGTQYSEYKGILLRFA